MTRSSDQSTASAKDGLNSLRGSADDVAPADGRKNPKAAGRYAWLLAGTVGLAVLIVSNAAWIHHYRFGLPFNIDEAGYLQRAFEYAQALNARNFDKVVQDWQRPDIVAPLLPIVAGVFGAFDHLSPWALLNVQQLFYALTVIATYFLARTMASVRWSLLVSFAVASLPGLLDSGRLFILAEPATALFMLTLLFQVQAKDFTSIRRGLTWGVSLGVFSLSRTMVLSLIPAFVLLAALRAVTASSPRIATRNLLISLSAAAVIGLAWYWTSWHTVYAYLTQYGYGAQARFYTGSHALSLWQRFTTRLSNITSQDMYLPILLAILIAAVISISAWAWRPRHSLQVDESASLRDASVPAGVIARLRRALGGSERCIIAVILLCVLALSTSSNSGSYFELPFVPAIVVAVIAPLSRLDRRRKLVSATVVTIACGLTLLDQFGLTPALAQFSSVNISHVSVTAFNDSEPDFVGSKLRSLHLGGVYWSNCGGATVTCFYGKSSGISTSYLRQWSVLNTKLVNFLYDYGPSHGYQPVVFFAYQGPLLNTNSIALTAQLMDESLPVGALLPPELRDGISLHEQLELPQFGQPNFVFAEGPVSATKATANSNQSMNLRVSELLQSDGFSIVARYPLPDAPPIFVWWKKR